MAWDVSTWVANTVATAAQMNARIRDNFKAIGDPWTAYTPAWTTSSSSPTLGNGTKTGKYMLAGKLCHVNVTLTLGSTSAMGTGLIHYLGLPFIPASIGHVLAGHIVEAGTRLYTAVGLLEDSGAARFTVVHGETTNSGYVKDTSPFTWGTGDRIWISGIYEVA